LPVRNEHSILIETATAQHAPSKPTTPIAGWPGIAAFLVVIFASIAIFFGQLGQVPLFNPDEGLYAEPAREMLDTGEYITTLLNYDVRFTKPPLSIWLMALSYKVFGINEFAARFPGALSAVLLIAVTYLFVVAFVNRRSAIFASTILLTSPMCIGVARMAITDMPLALFVTTGFFALFTAFERKRKDFLYLGYFAIGLAVMTKGPVGALLPVMILGAYHLLTGTLRDAFKFFDIRMGLIIIAAIAVPWFAVEIYLTKGAYFNEFILRENFGRFTSLVDSHKGAWWYHIVAMFGGFFPWSVFIPQTVAFSVLDVTGKSKQYSLSQPNFPAFDREQTLRKLRILLLSWILITLVFFSVSVSKLLTYTLPMFPALATLVAMELDWGIEQNRLKRLLLPLCTIALAFGLSTVLTGYALNRMHEAPVELTHTITTFAVCQGFAALFAASLILLGKKQQGVFAFMASFFALLLFFGGQLLPQLSKTFEGDTPVYASRAANSKIPFVLYDLRKPGIPFYTRRKVLQPADRAELDVILKGTNEALVITQKRDLKELEQVTGLTILERDARFALLRWQAIR
jgi:4-amino-4-deoxy-L-arabinose transferase-like glycosyltransferase